MMTRQFVIGTRGSQLALAQSHQVQTKLSLLNPGVTIRIEIIKTTGDVKTDPLAVIGGKGVFTKELEEALLSMHVDIAVHSLKDLPTTLKPGLTLAAIGEREDPRDAVVLPIEGKSNCSRVSDLPLHAVVGTSSPRRFAQLKHSRPDFDFRDLRGNVDTRLRKLDEGQYDLIVLAAAGLRRLGLENRISAAIPTEEIVPAVGQGALGIETRSDDDTAIALVQSINHRLTNLACSAERALLRALGGGCELPIAAHAVVKGNELHLDGLVASRDGSRLVRQNLSGSLDNIENLGEQLGASLLQQGAKELLSGHS